MKEIKNKLTTINNTWSRLVIDYKYLQKYVRYTDEEKTNYLADIFYYFDTTLDMVLNYTPISGLNSSVFQAIGLLQAIYAQQD